MSIEEIDKTIESGYLELSTKKKIEHYSSIFFTVFIGLFVGFIFVTKPTIELGLVFVGILVLTAFLYFLQRNRLKMTIIETKLKQKEIFEIIEQTAEVLEWYPAEIQDYIFLGKTHPNPFKSGSWGEQITILIHNNKILANSICDTDKQTSVVSFGRNKRNIQLFKNKILERENEVS
jgi:hypothetical protein